MTKHWGGPGLLAPPVITVGEGAQRDHHLDCRIGYSSSKRSCHRSSNPLLELGGRLDKSTGMAQDSCYRAKATNQGPWELQDGNSSGGKKKNYQRYPKPPYSYLAMIAMVIQNSPEKKLTLSEILKEISTLFPFFKGNYKGWRDSVRHNLSSYDCFVKVLKDPGKPQGKGNFWTVEVNRIPLELLKRQNTAVSRQDETIFAQDLAPYIFQGYSQPNKSKPLPPESSLPPVPTRHSPPPSEDPYRPKLDSTFAIDSLLHSLRPASSAGEGLRERESWGVGPPPHTRSTTPPRPCNASYNGSSSASSVSPASDFSDEDWRGVTVVGKRSGDRGITSDAYSDSCPPPNKSSKRGNTPPWELPTSYAKYTPPNAVAPPSMRFNGNPFMPLGGIPFYGYGSAHVTTSHLIGHPYWPILPSGPVSIQAPPLLMDLDSMLQSVPPNKSVFDALGSNNQTVHPSPNQYALQNGPSLCKYSL
ncbi:forkhead box protein H1 isoform X1 [Danio rerio]|uniref:Forkhead box protein H1 n=1 Tax=Danio rerio TaxID=7955 RepID=F1R6J3_DANRE|nr:forkhead box protein H1 isoform X1 [Danio rerio]|eukprot:XP_005156137.1 forkhead box protein H1 isoform X1 [Danio rerio]